jgi:hypothetical protein
MRDMSRPAILSQARSSATGGLEVESKNHAFRYAWPVKRPFKSGIEGQVPRFPLFVDDGTNFPSSGIRGKDGPLVADFCR